LTVPGKPSILCANGGCFPHTAVFQGEFMAVQPGHDRPGSTAPGDPITRWSLRSRWMLVWIVGGMGLLLSGVAYWLLVVQENQLLETQFRLDAERRVEAIRHEVDAMLGEVRTLAAFYEGSEKVERDEFFTFAQRLLSQRPKARALGWVVPTSEQQPGAPPSGAADRGDLPRRITQRDGRGKLVDAAGREVYFPVCFVEPVTAKQQLLGFDLGSIPALRDALIKGGETHRMAVAAACGLAGDADEEAYSICVFRPIFRRDPQNDFPEAPQETLAGLVFGVFRAGEVVEDAIANHLPVGIDTYLFGASPGAESPLLYAHASRLPGESLVRLSTLPQRPSDLMHYQSTLSVAGQQWTVYCIPTTAFLAAHRTLHPVGGLTGGVLLTGLLVVYLWLSVGQTARIEQLASRRTTELATISNSALDAVVMMDPDGNVVHWNPAAEQMFGYRREEILGGKVHQTLVPEKYRQKAADGMKEFSVSGRGFAVGKVLELEATRKDGSEFPVEISVSPFRQRGRWWAVAIIRDITKRRQAEEAVQKEQRLLRRSLSLHDRERKLLAYEIHDGLAQQLTGSLLLLQSIQGRDPEQAHKALGESIQLLQESLAEARRIIGGLRPPILDESGIVAAVEYLIAEQQRHGGLQIEFEHRLRAKRFAALLEGVLFRIVQESLTNAARHSRSEKVRIDLVQLDDCLRLVVEDWGVGFDPQRVAEHRFGLQGIRERARLLGGSASIDSAPGKGTRIAVELPLLETMPEENSSGRTAT